MPSKTKIILLLLFWFCAGARPRPSAYEAPGSRERRARRAPVRRCVDAPHARIHARSARAAVRGPGGVQFVHGAQGRRSSGPCGPDAPPSPLPHRLRPLGAQLAASFFFWVSKPSNSCNQNFSVTKHENRFGFARSYLAPAVICGKERPSSCRGAVQQPPAESWEVMRSVKSITSTKHVARLL